MYDIAAIQILYICKNAELNQQYKKAFEYTYLF